jgi:hypothetical protein
MVPRKESVESDTLSAVRDRMGKNGVTGIVVHSQLEANNVKARVKNKDISDLISVYSMVLRKK